MFSSMGSKISKHGQGLQAVDELHIPQEWKTMYSVEFFDKTDEWLAYGVQVLPFLVAKINKRLVEIAIVVFLVSIAIAQNLPETFNLGAMPIEWPDLLLAMVSILISFIWPRYYLLSKLEKQFLVSIENIHDCYYYGTLRPAMEKVNQANALFFEECHETYRKVSKNKSGPGSQEKIQKEAQKLMQE